MSLNTHEPDITVKFWHNTKNNLFLLFSFIKIDPKIDGAFAHCYILLTEKQIDLVFSQTFDVRYNF